VLAAGLVASASFDAAGAPARGEFASQSTSANLDAWLSAAQQHRPGEADEAVSTVAEWPAGRLDALLWNLMSRRARETLASHGAIDEASRNRLLKRVALLHTDIAILHREIQGYALPATKPGGLAVDDGRLLGQGTATAHWRVARAVLDLIQPNPQSDVEVRDWYQATGAWLQEWMEYSELRPHLARARQIFPRDAVFALYLGTMHGAFAEPRIQQALPPSSARAGSGGGTARLLAGETWEISAGREAAAMPPVDTPTGERNQAEVLFRQALQRDAALHEARVRLARLIALRGRHAEAVRELERVVAEPLPETLEYYARLILGQMLKRLGRPSDASRAFARAAELFPEAQSPRLALSQLAREQGDRRGAIEALAFLRRPSSAAVRRDPWHDYHQVHEPDAHALMGRLRAEWSR
jgi:hypothetical protein